MNIAKRLGESFTAELKRPVTQSLFVVMAIFLTGAIVQISHGRTNADQPFWVSVLWGFSPAVFFAPAAFPSQEAEGSFWIRFASFLAIHAVFLSIFFGLFTGVLHIHEPLITWVILALGAIEVTILILTARYFLKSTTEPAEKGALH